MKSPLFGYILRKTLPGPTQKPDCCYYGMLALQWTDHSVNLPKIKIDASGALYYAQVKAKPRRQMQ